MIIALAQRKGGAGKSTIAASMAAKLSNMGLSVGLIDSDEQKTIQNWGNRRVKNGKKDIEVRWCIGDIRDTIKNANERNDHVIIDTGGFDSVELRYALAAADLALAPYNPKQYDLETYGELKEVVSLMLPVNPKLIFRAVINRAPTNAKDTRSAEAIKFLEGKDIKCLTAKVFSREAWGDCTSDGRGVSEFNDEKASTEITNLITEILSYDK